MSNIKFEKDYILRNYRTITSVPDYALTEFIANSWDAGAYNVHINIPMELGQVISIEDDGTGMTNEEFMNRWMTLNYNRCENQGLKVEFPDPDDKSIRIPFGRNGIGRHGMFCFSDCYFVETWRDGIVNKYKISLTSGDAPYKIVEMTEDKKLGHGTKIYAITERHLPKYDEICNILSARFLYNPAFNVFINDKKIELLEHKNVVCSKDIEVNHKKLKITMIDSTKTATKNKQHGIAFWLGGRMVGNPSWIYNDIQFVDGRVKFAKSYTIIIETKDLYDFILPDWSGFFKNTNTLIFFQELQPVISELVKLIMNDQLDSIRNDVLQESRKEIEGLNLSAKRTISKFIEDITTQNPIINQSFLALAVETIAKIEKTKNGEFLLQRLNSLDEKSLNKLSEILNEWTVDDIALVLDEIDKRIVVIEALDRLCEDKSIDELHTIHPLILKSRWLFGPQFDSPMYTSNKSLSTIVKTLFKDSDYDSNALTFFKKRPDVVCLKKSTFMAVCSEKLDAEANILKPDQILIIEVKKGGFKIGAREVQQAEKYVREIKKVQYCTKNPTLLHML